MLMNFKYSLKKSGIGVILVDKSEVKTKFKNKIKCHINDVYIKTAL